MRKLLWLLAVVGALGCGSNAQTKVHHQPRILKAPVEAAEADPNDCPNLPKAEHAAIAQRDTEDGAALTFTTTTGDVNDLRARVRRMAEMHDKMQAMVGGDPADSPEDRQMLAAHVTVEDIPEGAQLLYSPRRASQLTSLRDQVRQHAEVMANGGCPTLSARSTRPSRHGRG